MSKRSPLFSAFDKTAYEFGEISDMAIALRAKNSPDSGNYLADLSALRRRLFVGRSVPEWLDGHGVTVPEKLLTCAEIHNGAIAVRLHRQQYLLIDSLDCTLSEGLFELEEGRHDEVLVLPYEAAEMACGGPHIGALMAELCPIDLSMVDDGTWIATRLAHCEAAIRRIGNPLHYRIVCSPADAQFLFGVLSQVTRERDGAILGFNDYRDRVA